MAVATLADRTIIIVAATGLVAPPVEQGAAQAACDTVVQQCSSARPSRWASWLADLDARMPRAGLAAAVVVEMHDGGIVGASVGDCERGSFQAT